MLLQLGMVAHAFCPALSIITSVRPLGLGFVQVRKCRTAIGKCLETPPPFTA